MNVATQRDWGAVLLQSLCAALVICVSPAEDKPKAFWETETIDPNSKKLSDPALF